MTRRRNDSNIFYTLYYYIVVANAAAAVSGNDRYNIYKTDYYVTFAVNGRALVLLLCGVRRGKSINQWTERTALIYIYI